MIKQPEVVAQQCFHIALVEQLVQSIWVTFFASWLAPDLHLNDRCKLLGKFNEGRASCLAAVSGVMNDFLPSLQKLKEFTADLVISGALPLIDQLLTLIAQGRQECDIATESKDGS
ncbi:MAG TPA: hypothetical protein VFW23_18440 [Tepidisphaeraceae bacterium]|nr:hypothetical protein [Tepidisphaeraceae bacterium]